MARQSLLCIVTALFLCNLFTFKTCRYVHHQNYRHQTKALATVLFTKMESLSDDSYYSDNGPTLNLHNFELAKRNLMTV